MAFLLLCTCARGARIPGRSHCCSSRYPFLLRAFKNSMFCHVFRTTPWHRTCHFAIPRSTRPAILKRSCVAVDMISFITGERRMRKGARRGAVPARRGATLVNTLTATETSRFSSVPTVALLLTEQMSWEEKARMLETDVAEELCCR